MNHFHIWCNLKAGTNARDFGDAAREFLVYLHEREYIEGYAIARRGFVIAPPDLGEFHVTVEFKSLEQMDRAMELVSDGSEEVAAFYNPLADWVRDVSLAMDRDYPEETQRPRAPLISPREQGEIR